VLEELENEGNVHDILPEGTIVADRYRIIEAIGHGGMGVVYKAEHIHIGRIVALKMLLDDRDNGVGFRRFKQEAKAASLIDHPNIVAIHDFGLISKDQAYLSMDFLEGSNLTDVLLQSAPLPLERFKHIFLQACAALEHAHSKGIVHRDIKPSNLLLIEKTERRTFLFLSISGWSS
jgi:eukaryotic-like serine/threonine-protein kinase